MRPHENSCKDAMRKWVILTPPTSASKHWELVESRKPPPSSYSSKESTPMLSMRGSTVFSVGSNKVYLQRDTSLLIIKATG